MFYRWHAPEFNWYTKEWVVEFETLSRFKLRDGGRILWKGIQIENGVTVAAHTDSDFLISEFLHDVIFDAGRPLIPGQNDDATSFEERLRAFEEEHGISITGKTRNFLGFILFDQN